MKVLSTSAIAAIALALTSAALAPCPVLAKASPMSDAAVKQQMIKESIADYPGNCPCPYNSARNGSSCGRRSAWSRGGGYAPLCFASDISEGDLAAYRRSHGL